jgi:hypothetical protein
MSATDKPNPRPAALLYALSGWPPPGPNYFRWQEGRLVYSLPDHSKRFEEWDRTVEPTHEQWTEFWRVCDELDVWSWPASVGNRRLIDGLQFVLELEDGERSVKSEGQCHGAPPGFAAKVTRLHETLQRMAGWQKLSEPA